MITVLDTISWAKEIETGNAQFVRDQTTGTLYVVSNVRPANNDFVVLKSDPVPPAPGPGASFTVIATISLPRSYCRF